VNARKYSKENRDRLVSMTDDELLAYERQRHGDPYMMVGTAKELLEDGPEVLASGAAREQAEKAREDARRELRTKLWPNGS
jgi:hypothetical protein